MTIRTPESALKEIASLRAKVDELEAENERLRETTNRKVEAIKRRFNLTANEARIVALLSDGHIHSRERIIEECVGTNMNELRNVDSHMKRIRAKNQVNFTAHYGIGYSLDEVSLAKVRAAIAKGERQ